MPGMKRATLYSAPPKASPAPEEKPAAPRRNLYKRHEKAVLLAAGALVGLCLVALQGVLAPAAPALTEADLDAAVTRVVRGKPAPSPAIKAYQAVRDSVVRVRAIGDGLERDDHAQRAIGTGVVIIDRGVILTNLHVVNGASRIVITFYNGLESEAKLLSSEPDKDLAVVQAAQVPDDLRAATLRSSRELVEGEHVTAVGFPFGIGPSVSAGVISGTAREYHQDGRSLSNLIQFDAAANPGSSGGPLVNAEGEVIGIVTAILTAGSTFSGVAFAVPIEAAASAAGLPPF
jgi:S1-C subfamily serine protease